MEEKDLLRELEKLQKEKKRTMKQQNRTEQANCCNSIGNVYTKLGQFEDALTSHREQLKLCEARGDAIGRAVSHRKLGENYMELKQFKKAKQHCSTYLEIAEDADNVLETQRAYVTLGRVYQEEAYNTEAKTPQVALFKQGRDKFQRSLELCESLKGQVERREYWEMRAGAYQNLALIFEGLGKFDESALLYKKAIELSQSNKLWDTLYRCQYNLTQAYLRNSSWAQAQKFARAAGETARSMKNKSAEREAYSTVAQVLHMYEYQRVLCDFPGLSNDNKKLG